MESHNIYGQLIGELGIPGTIVWFLLIRQIFINLIESKRKLKSLAMEKDFLYTLSLGIQISLIVRLFISMASHGLYYFYWYVMAALSIAILKSVEDISKNKLEEQDLLAENQLGKN
jgi:O-antigen ligase